MIVMEAPGLGADFFMVFFLCEEKFDLGFLGFHDLTSFICIFDDGSCSVFPPLTILSSSFFALFPPAVHDLSPFFPCFFRELAFPIYI